jgi:hypothetical protein
MDNMLQISARFCQGMTTIYKMALEEPRWEAVSPGSVYEIPMFRANFPGFTLKIVEHSRYLLTHAQPCSLTDNQMIQHLDLQ